MTILFYGVRLLASRPNPVNFGGPMTFCWVYSPSQVPVLRRWKPALHPTLICCTTHCALPLDHHEEAEFGFAGRACRLNTQEAFWYLTGHTIGISMPHQSHTSLRSRRIIITYGLINGSTVWCSRERLPAAAVQPAQGSSELCATDLFIFIVAQIT
jgi:hypothetical protein